MKKINPLDRFKISHILYKLLSRFLIAIFNFRSGDISYDALKHLY